MIMVFFFLFVLFLLRFFLVFFNRVIRFVTFRLIPTPTNPSVTVIFITVAIIVIILYAQHTRDEMG